MSLRAVRFSLFSVIIIFIIILICEKSYNYLANIVGHDQAPRFAASDMGLCCLPMSLLLNARHQCVYTYSRTNPLQSYISLKKYMGNKYRLEHS